MSRTIEELLARKPEARLRIYAWTPNDPPAAYVGLVKVGQTTQEDVNARIRQSQGQMQQAYTLHVDELAEREDGSIFRDSDVRQRLIGQGLRERRSSERRGSGSAAPPMTCRRRSPSCAPANELTGTHHETFADAARAG